MFSPADIAAEEKVRDPRISPDGHNVVYQITPFYRPHRYTTSALWIADATAPSTGSSCSLTDGQWNDHHPRWHPDNQRVFFLSDRLKRGRKSIFSIKASSGEVPLAVVSDEVISFSLSPDGIFLAFLSRFAHVENGSPSTKRLCIIQLADKEGLVNQKTFDSIDEYHWIGCDGIAYRSRDSKTRRNVLKAMNLRSNKPPCVLDVYERAPYDTTVTSRSALISLQSYEPTNIWDARTLFVLAPTELSAIQRIYGIHEDAIRLLNLGPRKLNFDLDGDFIAVEVASKFDTHIDILIVDSEHRPRKVLTIFETSSDAIWFNAWDAQIIPPSRESDGQFIVAVVLSSCARSTPPNLYIGKISFHVDPDTGVLDLSVTAPVNHKNMTCVSDHLTYLCGPLKIQHELWSYPTLHRDHLTGIARFPVGYSVSSNVKLPTVLMLHGGPYRRDIPDYMPYFCNWRELLASAGYLVLSPNYRGSQGFGHEFASSELSIPNMWSDCVAMLSHAISVGIVDTDRLGVAGWSCGGYLAAFGITAAATQSAPFFTCDPILRNLQFKAAVLGGAFSDWLSAIKDAPNPQKNASFIGLHDWNGHLDSETQSYLCSISAVRQAMGCNTATLILHGEKDEVVPVSQAESFMDALTRDGGPRAKAGSRLRIYPGEPHGFVERQHAEDVLNEVVEHFREWL